MSDIRDRLNARIMQMEDAIRRGAGSKMLLPVGLSTIFMAFVVVSIVAGLGLYYGNKVKYTDPLTQKPIWKDIILHSLAIGAAVAALGVGGLFLYRKFGGRLRIFG